MKKNTKLGTNVNIYLRPLLGPLKGPCKGGGWIWNFIGFMVNPPWSMMVFVLIR